MMKMNVSSPPNNLKRLPLFRAVIRSSVMIVSAIIKRTLDEEAVRAVEEKLS
jgi:hypothetical protein